MAHWELCQKDAEEVKILMKNNVEKVFEREGKLSDLEERSNDLLKIFRILHIKTQIVHSCIISSSGGVGSERVDRPIANKTSWLRC
uniref:V-SNARE coiled-coil homology domain-containing protein n=1 Tax=Leptobrachium leishanense TaxID=445787 RepID=A0A8C5M6C4_9ANUR